MISLILTFLSAKKEVDAEQVLCAVTLDTSIPADFRTLLHHLGVVSLLAGPWGLTWLRSN